MDIAQKIASIGAAESDLIAGKYLRADGTLVRIPKKEKEKLVILRALATRFEAGTRYAQRDIDAALGRVNEDHAALRRYLVDFGFMRREPDGSAYWLA